MAAEHEHSRAAIAARLAGGHRASSLRDWVYGAIDGAITTFAIVAGVVGADLETRIVLILGAANLFADGVSMAAANFVGTRAEVEEVARMRATEERHIDTEPAGEREEIRQIYAAKGLTGSALDQMVRLVTSRRRLWIDTMLAEEYGLSVAPRSPARAAAATFGAFVVAGSVPLLPFVVGLPNAALWAAGLTAAVFFGIGSLKSAWSPRGWLSSGLETLVIGLGAAAIAFGIGRVLEALV
jgi:VIT1/CCC1 family predicted Fe2+/Mn2+ transporter